MTKDQIRKTYLKKRQALTDHEFAELNKNVCEQFFKAIDFSKVNVIHTFLPIEKQREVNTWLIIERVQKNFPAVRIAVPRINNQSATIESFYYENRDQLEKNTWDILEPKEGVPVPTELISVVLVPLLAADTSGNRVGYGRGFYDKFLATTPKTAIKAGLSLFPTVDSIEGLSATDIPVDVVVTPEKTISVNV